MRAQESKELAKLSWSYLIGRVDILFSVIDAGVFTEAIQKELSICNHEIKRRLTTSLIGEVKR